MTDGRWDERGQGVWVRQRSLSCCRRGVGTRHGVLGIAVRVERVHLGLLREMSRSAVESERMVRWMHELRRRSVARIEKRKPEREPVLDRLWLQHVRR